MQRRLNIGTVDELFRDDEDEMKAEDDVFIQLAGENFEKSLKPVDSLPPIPNSVEQMKKNHFLAKIRLRKRGMSNTVCNFLADSFFDAEDWPMYAQEYILAKDFVYQRRLALAAFFAGHGLVDTEMTERIYKIWNLHWNNSRQWTQRFREFANLVDYFNKPIGDPDRERIMSTYYYFDMVRGRNLYLNGKIKN